MQNLIVSDVFGRTKALEKIASELSCAVDIFDPYGATNVNFKNESEAYSYFTAEVGLDKYTERLKKVIQTFSAQHNLIGFSVGASAIWRVSAQVEQKYISSATCFYGSQIRYHKNIHPTFPVHLIFPAAEEHFSVSKLITDLSGRKNTQIQQVSFNHGFMNRHSKNYDQSGYSQFMQRLVSGLK